MQADDIMQLIFLSGEWIQKSWVHLPDKNISSSEIKNTWIYTDLAF